MRQACEKFRRAFPDWRSDLQQLIAEGDLVAEDFIAHGTHHAALMGETPTGREVVLRGVNIFRIADGKIVERWGPPRSTGPATTARARGTATRRRDRV
jgi:predicted ester cyclase